MKNPNSPTARLKKSLFFRWSSEDYPGADPRFQLGLLGRDIAVFILLPVSAIIFYKSVENASTESKRIKPHIQPLRDGNRLEASKSQIIEFRSASSTSSIGSNTSGIFAKRAPGSLVRVKLLNVVETYSNAPVHVRIVDSGLGKRLQGGSLIGDAISDPNFERISINFRYARDQFRENVAVPLSARALSLDGTLGLEAKKKEGFFARSAIGSASSSTQDLHGKSSNNNFQDVLIKALTSGFLQELGSGAQVAKNRAQVMTLAPGIEFFAELTDFFPGTGK